MSYGSPTAVTPGRITKLRWNAFVYVMNQGLWFPMRNAEALAQGEGGAVSDVELKEGIGYRLKKTNAGGALWESEDSATDEAGAITSSTGIFAAYYDQNRASDSSGLYYVKNRAATSSWADTTNIADKTAYPGPAQLDGTTIERVYVGNEVIDPDRSIAFYFCAPGTLLMQRRTLAIFYFSGPSGDDARLAGYGQYALRVYGDGLAELWERGTNDAGTPNTWALRHEFRYAGEVSAGKVFGLIIDTNAVKDDAGNWKGSRITFESTLPVSASYNASAGGLINMLQDAAAGAIATSFHLKPRLATYDVPGANRNAVTSVPIRIDARQNVRVRFTAHVARYKTTGYIIDSVMRMPFWPDSTNPIQVEVYAHIPTGTSVTAKLYWVESDGVTEHEITADSTYVDWRGLVNRYTVPAERPRDYFVKITLNGDGTNTPTVTTLKCYRAPVYEIPSFTQTVLPESYSQLPTAFVTSVGVDGPAEDGGTESAQVTYEDHSGSYSSLKDFTSVPLDIEIRDPDTDDLLTILHHGYIDRSSYQYRVSDRERASSDVQWPRNGSFGATVHTTSEWERASRVICNTLVSFSDPGSELAPKVTDALRFCFNACRYPNAMLDIPDLDIRMWAEAGTEISVNPGTRWVDVIDSLTTNYLGGWWVFDRNAGDYGMWRLRRRKVPPFTPLMSFYRARPGDGIVPHMVGAYAARTSGSQTTAPNYIVAGTEDQWWEPPEGNIVTILGVTRGAATLNSYLVGQSFCNFASANFLNLDSSHPSYPVESSPDFMGEPVPIYVYVDSMPTGTDGELAQNYVNWVGRRVYDVACHARQYMTFRAPLRFVLEASDTLATNPRILLPGDIVEVQNKATLDWENWIVIRCRPQYDNDAFQFATYELMRPTNIDEFMAPIGPWDEYALQKRRYGGAMRKMGTHPRTEMFFQGQSGVNIGRGAIVQFPMLPTSDVQDVDPDSPDFGSFLPMVDYD